MATTNARRATAKKITPRPPKKITVPRPKEEGELDSIEEFEAEQEAEESAIQDTTPQVLKDLAAEAIEAANEVITSPKRLTNSDIMAVQDRTQEDFFVSEWGGTVEIRSLGARMIGMFLGDGADGGEGMEITEDGGMKVSFKSMQQQVIQAGVIDPVVTDDMYQVWMEKGVAPVMKVFSRIMEISNLKGVGKDKSSIAVEEEKAKFRKTGQ